MRSNINMKAIADQVDEIMSSNRAKFGGWKMMAQTPDGESENAGGGAESGGKSDGDKGRAGGESAVLADLAKERKARQDLEKQVAGLAPLQDQMKALREAFGVESKGDDGADTILQIQKQIAAMQRDNTVLAIANEHGITDRADIDILRQSSLEGEALSTLAGRLKPAAESDVKTPKPDGSQGGHGDPPPVDPGPGVPRLAQAFDDELNN